MAAGEESNIVKLLRVYAASVQDAENALQQLYSERRIDNATGVTLTLLGEIVGQPRRGITDDDVYRRYVRARVKTNRSNGVVQDLIRITELVLDDDEVGIHVKQERVATVVVQLNKDALDYSLAQIVRDFLVEGVAGGVHVIVEFTPAARAATFAFASYGGGTPPEGKGFGTVLGDYDEGIFASALD